jgi:hypothetical protein
MIVLILVASAALVVAPVVASPGLYVSVMPHDTLSMADIGYRMAHGQSPGRDFHSAFGVIFQWQMGLAWTLAPTVAGTMKAATVLFAAVYALFAAYIARTRLSSLGALVLIPAGLILGAAPYAEADANLSGATYAMMYNREAWVFLLLALLFWLPPRRGAARWRDGVPLGLLVALCVYFKLSYGGMALAFLGLWALLIPDRRWAALTAAVTAGVVALLPEAIYGPGFNLAYLTDILVAARAGGDRLNHILYNVFSARAEWLVGGVLIPVLAAARGHLKARDWIFLAFCAASGLLVIWQNAQVDGLVTLWAGVAMALEPGLATPRENPGRAWKALTSYGVWSVLTLTPSLLAIGQTVFGDWLITPIAADLAPIADVRFDAPLPDKRLRGGGAVYGDEYVAQLEDGVRLLRACPPGDAVATFDLFEPFTMLQARTPNHGWSWRHFNHSFSVASHPDPTREFAGVSCILIPHRPTAPATTAALIRLYGPFLERAFPRVAVSRDWTLRMRPAP